MDELIIKMQKNKHCDIPDKFFGECVLILACIIPLLIADIFINEVCYDTSIWGIVKKIIILCAVILIVISKVRKYVNFKKNRKSLECNKKQIQAIFNVKEFRTYISMRCYHLCSYYIVGYYIEGNRTYRFDCEIYDRQRPLSDVFGYIQEKGLFPEKIDVYVDATNYNNYQMQVYEFLDATLKMNRGLAEYAYGNVKFGVDIGNYTYNKDSNVNRRA